MKFKKLLSTVMAMAIVSAIGANAFALDKSVTVYKNIVNNEFYTGMGAHSAKAFSNGIVVNNNTDLKLERVKTKKIYVGIFGGYIYELTLQGQEGKLDGYEFNFENKNVTPTNLANTSRKYYSGQAKIKVVGIPHGEKHVDLEINN
ncbi:hypothetical protein [Peptostreptococcus stomatis]|jgi:hypothetical protein|uniref:hypothetical protein n=1 Tax=Peptostreptococcus stomatis TaxID=341694 RepID=UPI0026EABDF1|nr:hypothetical protein [Peptostreptococcus stomatis]